MPRRRLGGGGLRGRLADRAGAGGANDDAADGDDQDATGQEAPPSADQGSAAPSTDESMDELTKLKGLLDAGVLTQDEFDAQKQKILQSM